MKPYFKITTVLTLAIAIASCSGKRDNQVFQKSDPASKEYKTELARQLQSADAAGYTYLFNKYVVIDGKEYLDIAVKGDGINATGLVLVNNWGKMAGIKATKGMGYSGAELKDLKLDVIGNNPYACLQLKSVGQIID